MSDETTEVAETPSDLEVALGHLQPLIDVEASEEDMVIELIQNGFKFARAGRLMNQVLESQGLKMSAKNRFAAVEEMLTAWEFAPADWSDVDACASSLAEEVEATSKSQAIQAIRKFAKQNGIEMPVKPKGIGGVTKVSKFDQFHAWALDNRDSDDDDIVNFAKSITLKDGESNDKQAIKYASVFTSMIELARAFVK